MISIAGQTKVFLADPYLASASGHCLPYLTSIRDELLARNCVCVIVGNQKIPSELTHDFEIIPNFSSQFVGQADAREMGIWVWVQNTLRGRGAFYRDLRRLEKREMFSTSDILVINSLRPEQMSDLAKWISTQSEENCPRIVVICHYTIHQEEETSSRVIDCYKKAWRNLHASNLKNQVVVVADTQQLVDEVQLLSGFPVALIPVPHTVPIVRLANERTTLKLGFMGEARPDKGFDKLLGLAVSLSDRLKRNELSFRIQGSSPEHQEHNYQAQISEMVNCGCTVVQNSLSEDEYYSMLSELDIVLLPYTGRHYRYQTSGVLVEALCMGKVVVVPCHTWMAEMLNSYGGGVVFDPEVEDSLIVAVNSTIDGYSKLSNAAKESALLWQQHHNPSRFVDVVFEELQRVQKASGGV